MSASSMPMSRSTTAAIGGRCGRPDNERLLELRSWHLPALR
jgi:hypothetical protein